MTYRWLRSTIKFCTPGFIRRLDIVQRNKTRLLPHSYFYDEAYYRWHVDGFALAAAPVMVSSLIERFSPSRIADLGCGPGALLQQAQAEGIEVQGFELAQAALSLCAERGVPALRFNIETSEIPEVYRKSFDVAVSFEVAEHLPEATADRFLTALTALSDRIVMSAATPGQGGLDHVNEQPHDYWIQKLAQRGYAYQEAITASWRASWREAGLASFYADNVMVFSR